MCSCKVKSYKGINQVNEKKQLESWLVLAGYLVTNLVTTVTIIILLI